jgi:periplasmic protein TonB
MNGGMRLTASLVAAAALHGLLLGVATAVLSRQEAPRPAPAPVEVDVISPRPDPIADSAATATEAPTKSPEPPRPRIHPHHRKVTLVGDSAPGGPTAATEAPSPVPSALASTGAPAATAMVRARLSEASAGGGATVSASPRYYANPTPDYPLPCKRRREEGIVLLNVVVQADGLPAAISLKRSSGHPLLDRAALDAVRRWTFEPGRAAGVPVASLVVVPVRFSLEQP